MQEAELLLLLLLLLPHCTPSSCVHLLLQEGQLASSASLAAFSASPSLALQEHSSKATVQFITVWMLLFGNIDRLF
jgi:hypothetical protein